ncbi:MAG: RNA-binding protein [Polyangiaceae bacterium]|nr:RNA-binding protein [Polyangiaceae bacterium]
MKKLYVGNLSYSTTEDVLRESFSRFGQVSDVAVISDKFTGRSRGFGFVEMPEDGEADQAIEAMHGAELDGRTLTVNEARPKEARPPRRAGGGGGGFSGGGFSGGGGYGGGSDDDIPF